MPENSMVEREVSRSFDNPSKNETTIREILNIKAELEPYLNEWGYSAQRIEYPYKEKTKKLNLISNIEEEVWVEKKGWKWKRLPTEEKMISCIIMGARECESKYKNFMPDTAQTFAVDPEYFEGMVAVWNESEKKEEIDKKLQKIQKHMKTVHKIDIEIEDLKYNSKWLTWEPMFKSEKGFLSWRSYVLSHCTSLSSTTIYPESRGKDNSRQLKQELLDDAVDDALSNVQDIILNHRNYGFDIGNQTQIVQLLRFEKYLFLAANSRSINGTTIRGIISNMEERRVSVYNEGGNAETERRRNEIIPKR